MLDGKYGQCSMSHLGSHFLPPPPCSLLYRPAFGPSDQALRTSSREANDRAAQKKRCASFCSAWTASVSSAFAILSLSAASARGDTKDPCSSCWLTLCLLQILPGGSETPPQQLHTSAWWSASAGGMEAVCQGVAHSSLCHSFNSLHAPCC